MDDATPEESKPKGIKPAKLTAIIIAVIIVALAGVGLKCNIESLLKPGIRPIFLGVATSAAVLISSITTIGLILHL